MDNLADATAIAAERARDLDTERYWGKDGEEPTLLGSVISACHVGGDYALDVLVEDMLLSGDHVAENVLSRMVEIELSPNDNFSDMKATQLGYYMHGLLAKYLKG